MKRMLTVAMVVVLLSIVTLVVDSTEIAYLSNSTISMDGKEMILVPCKA